MKNSSLFPAFIALFILPALFFTSTAFADDVPDKAKFFEEMMKNKPQSFGPTDDPPPQPAIPVAEWEPATGVLVTYPLNIPIHLVAEMAEIVEIWSVVNNESNMQQALQEYLRAGIDTSNCHFLITGFWSTPWTRDFGPWYIFNGDDEQGIINNIYYGGIPCTQVPQMLGDTLGIPVYDTGLHAEGGNYMTDGMGTAITTTYTYWGNEPLTPDQIDGIFAEYLGINNLVTVPHPWGTMVPHIDCHAKLLDPGRIIVIETNPPNAIIEANVEYWSTLMSGYGRPYEILRIPGLGYANSLFLNDHVFVALSGNPIGDSTAVATFQEALPGYEVMGFTYPQFSFLDALHCRTHEMADRYMLRIVHVPLHDMENTGSNYHVTANIHPYSNEPLVGSPYIVWNVDGGTYNYTPMTLVSDYDYEGYIPQQPDGSDIYYYLEAEDGSGRLENHPYIGPGNPHHFYVGPDTEPPVVEFEPPETLIVPEWPYVFKAYALDNRWISSVNLEYSINNIPQVDIDMPLLEPYAVYYEGTPDVAVQPGDIVEVRVKAMDTSVNQNTTYSPEAGYYTIAIMGAPDVTIVLTPVALPIVIPANGGTFDFNIEIANNETAAETFDVWTMVELPDSTVYGPILTVYNYTLPSGQSVNRDRTQSVPTNAPPGEYEYLAYIGEYSDIIWHYDSFNFEKLETDNGGSMVSGWNNFGEEFGDIVAICESIPAKFALHDAYPNPFNPVTTISFDLPAAGKVSLMVYDIQGREVSRLVDGFRNAGSHEVLFDGSDLSSGVYFTRLISGAFQQTVKLLLMK